MQRHRARVDGAAQQPVPGHRRVEPQQLFADPLGVRVGEGEADVVGQGAEIGGVVVEPFEFDEQGPQPVRFVGQFDAERVLDRQAVGERMRGGGVAADPFGEVDRAGGGPALEEFLEAAVHEPQPRLQAQHRLADDGEPEVAGLDQPGVHGADRDLVHPGSFDGEEREAARSVRTPVLARRRRASDASLRASARGGPGGAAGDGRSAGCRTGRPFPARTGPPGRTDTPATAAPDRLRARRHSSSTRRSGRPARNR